MLTVEEAKRHQRKTAEVYPREDPNTNAAQIRARETTRLLDSATFAGGDQPCCRTLELLLSRHPRFAWGRNSRHWGNVLLVWGLCPTAVPPPGGRAPGRWTWGRKLKAFRYISSKFLYFLGGIVEIRHLDVMFTVTARA